MTFKFYFSQFYNKLKAIQFHINAFCVSTILSFLMYYQTFKIMKKKKLNLSIYWCKNVLYILKTISFSSFSKDNKFVEIHKLKCSLYLSLSLSFSCSLLFSSLCYLSPLSLPFFLGDDNSRTTLTVTWPTSSRHTGIVTIFFIIRHWLFCHSGVC